MNKQTVTLPLLLKKTFFLLLAMSIHLSLMAQCPANLLTNPSFENGFQSWTILNQASLDTDANSGTQAVRIAPNENRIYQFLTAVPGETYSLSAQVKTAPMGSYGTIAIKFLSSSWQPLDDYASSLLLQGGYQEIGPLSRTAPTGTAYIEVSIYNFQSSELLVDDVCLTDGTGVPCDITGQLTNVTCDDNGTPSDNTDDNFSFDFLLTGTNASPTGWTATIAGTTISGNYGSPTPAGTYPISGGSVPFNVVDNDDAGCTLGGLAVPPPPCSNNSPNCEIIVESLGTTCDDNGTPSNPDDDVFFVEILVTGSNTGASGWFTQPLGVTVTGEYDVPQTFGPFPISGGQAIFAVSDAELGFCNVQLNVSPPPSCSSPIICQGDTLTSQAEVDAWAGCNIVEGNLRIAGNDITDLSPLTSLQIVRGALLIDDNPVLINLSGLENVDSVDALIIAFNQQLENIDALNLGQDDIASIVIYDNDDLTSISGFNNLTRNENIEILNNDGLTSISGFSNLEMVEGKIHIHNHPNLTSISGFQDLTEVTENLHFLGNDVLETISGFGNLTTVGGIFLFNVNDGLKNLDGFTSISNLNDIVLAGNSALEQIDALSSINSISGFLTIIDNPVLSDCCGVYPMLNSGGVGGTIDIEDNPMFCASETEILDNCAPNGDIDLSINLVQPNGSPAQWSSYDVVLTINNAGPQTATGVQVDFIKPNGVVYTGGNEFTASQGTFSAFSNEVWNVGSIPAGGSATLTVSYFLLVSESPMAYAQVSTANETDGDSTPGNGTPPSVNEDDEANTDGGTTPLPDLVLGSLNIQNSPVEAGQVLNYEFDISNQGAGAANGNFVVKAYISADNTISADDIQDGIVPTGNYGPGLTVSDVLGASTIPAGLSDGQYFLILKVDADGQIVEASEGNNEISMAFQVIDGSGGLADLTINTPFGAPDEIVFNQGRDHITIINVENIGLAATTENTTVEVYISEDDQLDVTEDAFFAQAGYSPLAPGEDDTNAPQISNNIITEGEFGLDRNQVNYYWIAVVNRGQDIAESNFANNIAVKPFTVSVPDYDVAVFVDLAPPTQVEAGQSYVVDFNSQNLGSYNPSQTDYDFNDAVSMVVLGATPNITDPFIDNLAPSIPFNAIPYFNYTEITIPPGIPDGQYFIRYYVANSLTEITTANNFIAIPVTVGGGAPSCSFTTFYTPSPLAPPSINFGKDFSFQETPDGYIISEDFSTHAPVAPDYDTYELDLEGNVVSTFETPIAPTIDVVVQTTSDDNLEMVFNLSPDLPAGTIVPVDLDYPNPPAAVFASGQVLKTSTGYAFGVGIVDLTLSPNIVNRVYQTDNVGQNVTWAELPDSDFYFGSTPFYEGPDGSIFSDWRTSGNFSLFVVPGDGSAPWQARVASDTPSSSWIETKVSHDGQFVYTLKTDNSQAYLAKYNVSTGDLLGINLADLKASTVPSGFRYTWAHGIEPTSDGGVLVSLRADEVTTSPLDDFEVLAKYDAAGSLVWKTEIPQPNFHLTPIGETSDGGTLFVGGDGVEFGPSSTQSVFLKTAENGALIPECGGGSGGGDIDLSLAMSTSNASPSIYSSTEVTVEITNGGPQSATGIVVDFPRPAGTVYTGGNEWDATQGGFNPFGNEKWTVGNLALGETASLTVSYFLLTGDALTPYAQVEAANETDGDSSPGNGTCCTASEDDEATLTLNAFAGGGSGTQIAAPDFVGRPVRLLNVYPTPTYHGEVNLKIASQDEREELLEIYDSFGRLAFRQKVELQAGFNEMSLDISGFRSGIYQIVIPGHNLRNMPRSIVVERW